VILDDPLRMPRSNAMSVRKAQVPGSSPGGGFPENPFEQTISVELPVGPLPLHTPFSGVGLPQATPGGFVVPQSWKPYQAVFQSLHTRLELQSLHGCLSGTVPVPSLRRL
jgi:hypothetical protein